MSRKRYLVVFSICTLVTPLVAAQNLDRLMLLENGTSARASSSHPDLHKNGDAKTLEPGGTLVLADLSGPGVIRHIWMTIGSRDPFFGRSLVLKIFWDDADSPSVLAPLGDFFGVGFGARVDFASLPVTVSSHGRAFNCVWPMPFRRRARITLTNDATRYGKTSVYYQIDWERVDPLPDSVGYFHAWYRQAAPATPGDYVVLETQGRGKYVGTVYSVLQNEIGWFGEGDDRFWIDGESTPRLRGTGTEDYFGDAWGFRRFSYPFNGVPLWEGYFAGDRVSAYRWHLLDPVLFEKSLKVSFEHKGSVYTDAGQHLGQFIERADWISSVAFWYQWPPKTIGEKLAPLSERLPPWRILPACSLHVRAEPAEAVRSGDPEVVFWPARPDGTISFRFDVKKAGLYRIDGILTYSVFGARYQPLLDGKPLGSELDLSASGEDPVWVRFDLHRLESGTHEIRFEGRGASPTHRTMAPPLYAFGLDYLLLLRLEDVRGFHVARDRVLRKRNQ